MTPAALFDLDGTLVESGPSIMASVRHAMHAVGHPLDPAEDLSWVVGPPLRDIFSRLLEPFGAGQVEAAAAMYRENYDSVGLFEAKPYRDIAAALDAFRAAGFSLVVATSKPASVARRLLAYLGLADRFRAIYGATADGALSHKPDLVAYILATQGFSSTATVMLGDRGFDIFGAHANEVRAVGVLWGYGTRDELEQAGADALAEAPAELLELATRLCHGGGG
jgi:phosphoglycolate phosphatase